MISGVAMGVSGGVGTGPPLAGVHVTIYSMFDDSVMATTTTAAGGTYSLPRPADCNIYVKGSLEPYSDTYLFLERPCDRYPSRLDLGMVTREALTGFYTDVGITQDMVAGTIMASLPTQNIDCALLTVSETGTVRYGLPPSPTATMSFDGVAWNFNGPVTASGPSIDVSGRCSCAQCSQRPFSQIQMKIFAGALSTTVLEAGIPP
jgi:hypothetical protein